MDTPSGNWLQTALNRSGRPWIRLTTSSSRREATAEYSLAKAQITMVGFSAFNNDIRTHYTRPCYIM